MIPDLLDVLGMTLRDAHQQVSFVITELPQDMADMRALVDGALRLADEARQRLVEVQIEPARHAELLAAFAGVVLSGTARAGVMRLVFEPAQSSGAQA